jgi:Zn-dependent M16 (insulinase) family peptidase
VAAVQRQQRQHVEDPDEQVEPGQQQDERRPLPCLHGLPADYLKTYVQRIYAVTPQDVQKLAEKYIQDDKATIVVVGDKKVIEEQIKPYGTIVQ